MFQERKYTFTTRERSVAATTCMQYVRFTLILNLLDITLARLYNKRNPISPHSYLIPTFLPSKRNKSCSTTVKKGGLPGDLPFKKPTTTRTPSLPTSFKKHTRTRPRSSMLCNPKWRRIPSILRVVLNQCPAQLNNVLTHLYIKHYLASSSLHNNTI